jgi:negative regulator of sigma E activity
MSDQLAELAREMRELRKLNDGQSALLAKIDMALTGDSARGIVGIVISQKALADRMDAAEADIEDLKKEKWFSRLGQSAIAGAAGAAAMWLKSKFFGEN